MSGNSVDRRTARTRYRISQAFLRLGGSRAIDQIRVDDLAREAGIARSTFYAHFQGLDDYMARSFAEMLARFAGNGAAKHILPVTAILDHIGAVGPDAAKLARHRHFPRMLSEGERALRRVAEARLIQQIPDLDLIERQSVATMLAAGFLALLRDWMEDSRDRSAADIAARFERLEQRLVGHGTLS